MKYRIYFLCSIIISQSFLLHSSFSKNRDNVITCPNRSFDLLLGYDPKIEWYTPKNRNSFITKNPTLYLHGYGVDKTFFYGALDQGKLPTPAILFNFSDVDKKSSNCFGQQEDIKSAAYMLNHLRKAGHTAVNIFAHSRGGAACINLIAALCSNSYSKEMEQIGITKHNQQEILGMLQRGKIILKSPLKDVSVAIKKIVTRRRERLIRASIGRFFSSHEKRNWMSRILCNTSSLWAQVGDKLVAQAIHYIWLPLTTCYNPLGQQALDAIDNFSNDIKFNILIHYVKEDKIVDNKYDTEFVAKLQQTGSHVIAMTSEGNHQNILQDDFIDKLNEFLQEDILDENHTSSRSLCSISNRAHASR